MTRLTKGLYGHEFRGTSDLFGIICGQIRGAGLVVHNGGWYNRAGEKLGWGDLNAGDLTRISQQLEEDELFIILSEGDSFWNFVTHNPGIIGSMCKTAPTAEAPGVDYVAEKCHLIIAKGSVYYVDRYGSYVGQETIEFGRGVRCKVLTAETVRRLITLPCGSA